MSANINVTDPRKAIARMPASYAFHRFSGAEKDMGALGVLARLMVFVAGGTPALHFSGEMVWNKGRTIRSCDCPADPH
ncbi:MAG: hypothetical protein LBI59_01775 [Candidatus Accumulibacter sp.]|jgi:hypothetical protein|nr:hypothetical protein [Accumulibacter sp.]